MAKQRKVLMVRYSCKKRRKEEREGVRRKQETDIVNIHQSKCFKTYRRGSYIMEHIQNKKPYKQN